MRIKTSFFAALSLMASGAHAQAPVSSGEVTVYASTMSAKYDSLEDAGLEKPQGFGGGLRFSGYFSESAEIYGELQQNSLDIDTEPLGADINAKGRVRQARLGLRGTLSRPIDAGAVYAKLGAQFIHTELRVSADGFFSESDSEDLPLGQLRAGFLSGPLDVYAEGGYGANDNLTATEGLVGLSYSFVPGWAAMVEARLSKLDFDGSDEDETYTDIRIGVTSKF